MSEDPDVADIPTQYISFDTDERGTVRVYFRRRGHRKVRIKERLGSPVFHKRYAALCAQSDAGELKFNPSGGPKRGTWRWLYVEYFASSAFRDLDPSTQHVRKQVLESTWDEPIAPGDPVTFANCPLTDFGAKAVRILRQRKRDYPEAGNVRVKAIRRVFAWALEEEVEGVTESPARDVSRLKPKRPGGHHSWTGEEVEQFLERHPIGTKAHLALTLLFYGGGRRGDVVRLGRQHTRNGQLRYTQEKNARRNPVIVDIKMPTELQRVIDASPVGDLTFLVIEAGKPFTKAGFGNWFRERCNEANLPHCSAHGLRKAAATRVAENGGTTNEVKAIFGWRSDREPERYTQAADRKLLGSTAGRLLTQPKG